MSLSAVVNIVVCALIIVFGVLIFLASHRTHLILDKIYKAFDKIIIREQTRDAEGEQMDPEGNVAVSTVLTVHYDRNELERNREDFSRAYANYVTLGQLTSLLPLAGIFGTVLGLIIGSRASDVDQMVSGLGTAMWTTLFGLTFSIVIRFLDAVFLGRLVNLIDAKFNEADTIITRNTLQAELRKTKSDMEKER